jgi:hypothetical protein
MEIIRYGVFNLAQIWTVVCDDGVQLGFPNRSAAVDAAECMARLHRSYGGDTEVFLQDELGFVRLFPTELGEPESGGKEPRASQES